jgi:hypothetical protein
MADRTRTQEEPAIRTRRHAGDGLTTAERERPFTDDPGLLATEERFAESAPDQLPLFAPGPRGAFSPVLGGLPPLQSGSSLDLARSWYRREL